VVATGATQRQPAAFEMRRGAWAPLCALVGVALAASCGGGDGDDAPLPPRAQVLEVAMKEYRFGYRPPSSPGRVVLSAKNNGKLRHEVVLLELPEDFPPIKEQLAGENRRAVGTLAYTKPVRPGRRGVLAVDLKRARYAMVCLQQAGHGRRHAERGMATEFRVR
jgi:hypothetical protein